MRAIETMRPDVVLLDLMMPGLDGFGVIEGLHSDSELSRIPVILISAEDLTGTEERIAGRASL